jgi:hypothetical protein
MTTQLPKSGAQKTTSPVRGCFGKKKTRTLGRAAYAQILKYNHPPAPPARSHAAGGAKTTAMKNSETARQAIIADIKNNTANADAWQVFSAVESVNVSHWRGTLGRWYRLDGLIPYLRRRENDLQAAGVFDFPDNRANWEKFLNNKTTQP